MLVRVALFVLMAIGLGGFGTVAWISTRPANKPQTVAQAAPARVTASVLTAARVLRAGTLLKPDDLATANLAPTDVPAGAKLDTPAARGELLGAMLRHQVQPGEPLLPVNVIRAGDRGFLAAVLATGMRAATVGVDAITGTAGLIWPGDHVDLILTQTIDQPSAPIGRRVAGETVLRNVRVIAIDQELMQGATAAAATPQGGQSGRTVTLEVSPENAERVAVATRLGHLSLSVVSADTPEPPAPVPTTALDLASDPERGAVTWGGDVSAALQTSHKADPVTGTLHVFEGNAEGKEYHF